MMDAEIPTTVQTFFQSELLDRCRKNPRYSLRAFARQLSLHPGTLSQILRGKRMVSNRKLLRLADRLDISPVVLKQLLRSNSTRNQTSRWHADLPVLANDVFNAIGDWYHFAILELTSIRSFQSNSNWVANRLGISPIEVNAAVSRLRRLGLLEVGPSGEWMNRFHNIGMPDTPRTSSAKRKLQRQLLEKALLSLDEVPVELRDHTSMTMAIDQCKISEARELITNFRRNLCALLQGGSNNDSVYNLAICLYPLTTNTEIAKPLQRSQLCA